MANEIEDHVVQNVRNLYASSVHAKLLFDWIASLKRDAYATSIDRIGYILDISRASAVELAKKLEEAGCGTFIIGRRGGVTRLEWSYSRISLGQVATGETEELEEQIEPVGLEDDEQLIVADQHLTIPEAKKRLAESIGISPEQIEIQIRA